MFEWDEQKNTINIEKHGVDFQDAKGIFDGFTLQREDSRKDYGETRYVALGEVYGVVLIVVYTRRGEAIRLISARGANSKERTLYYAQKNQD